MEVNERWRKMNKYEERWRKKKKAEEMWIFNKGIYVTTHFRSWLVRG